MYYKVNDAYRLVGWKNLPTGVSDVSKNEVIFLPRDEYSILLHMNGQEELDFDALTPKQQETVKKYLQNGFIQSKDTPFPKSEQPLYHFYNHVFIKKIQWSLTGKCNYNCRHCFVSAPENYTDDLTTEQCLDIIRQIADCGIREITLTGGEPLVRKDLPELIKACSDAGIRIARVLTNGALLTPQVLEQFIRMGHRPSIQVSYDGVGWHDWVRGRKGAEQIAERALLAAHEAGLKTGAAMCLFRDNIPAIRETVNRLASLFVSNVKISPMMSKGLWNDHYAEKTLTSEESLQAVLDYIPDFIADGTPCDLAMNGYFDYIKDKDIFTSSMVKNPDTRAPVFPCPGIVSNLYITQTGKVLPCMESIGLPELEDFPTLLETPLAQILRDSVWLRTTRTTTKEIYDRNPECQNCPERGKHCGLSCRAHATPGFFGIDCSTCLLIKNGWYRQIQETVEKAGGTFVLT